MREPVGLETDVARLTARPLAKGANEQVVELCNTRVQEWGHDRSA